MLYNIIINTNSFLWGWPFMIFIISIGCYFMLLSRFFPVLHFYHIINQTIFSLWDDKSKENYKKRKGTISPFESACIAIGGAVGCTSIGGVVTAIATGGPGAVFWMWLWALLGMVIKCAETALGCYYRYKNEKGEYYGGSVYFISDGIGGDLHFPRIAKYLALLFSFGFVAQFLGGSQVFTIAEILNRSFGFDMITVTIIYSLALFYIIFKGVPRIASFAVRVVPFMCIVFILAGLIIIAVNHQNISYAFYLIFSSAFNDSAPIGGFTGAVLSQTIADGVARSINSNEAGQGSSPLIYGSADTVHPIRQGLWGSFDVFINTIVISTITVLVVLVTGVWNSGQFGATLTIMAYESVYGYSGVVLIGIVAILFGLTTTTGWFTYYVSVIQYVFKDYPKIRDRVILILKFAYPIPNIGIVSSIILTGNGPDLFWALVNITLVLPVGFNLCALFILRNKFRELLGDYKARYLGIGKVNPDFKIFRNTSS
ncbi:alanine/glycine:cation symporter family protein [Veillonella criceti]|uniref:Na+/alanine symporter n=1 Tax=Veillonella criceti TaxID=103891 RepID=A0A380NL69_9FIRM|nr:amino acid carrier protein [Veillonella criceti]SUP43812.1 Na+/alanine symporter [Veillonella criceti]